MQSETRINKTYFTETNEAAFRSITPEARANIEKAVNRVLTWAPAALVADDDDFENMYENAHAAQQYGARMLADLPPPCRPREERRAWYSTRIDNALIAKELLDRTAP